MSSNFGKKNYSMFFGEEGPLSRNITAYKRVQDLRQSLDFYDSKPNLSIQEGRLFQFSEYSKKVAKIRA